jgi:hypothetical protein
MRTTDFLLETLAHFVRLDSSPPPGIPAHAGADFEKDLILLCQAQHLAPIVLDSLDRLSLGPQLSRIAMERLRAMARSIARRCAQRRALAEKLGEDFARDGIPCLFVGDVVAASTLYPSLDVRHVRRVEVLMNENDWQRIEAVFNRHGFTRPAGAPSLHDPADVLSYYQFFSPCVFRNESGDAVKLRFRLFDIGPAEDDSLVWARGGDDVPGGKTMYMLSREDRIIGSVLEWNRSGFTDLLALLDIALLLAKDQGAIDWSYIGRMLHEHGFSSSFSLALDHAGRQLKTRFEHSLPVLPGALKRKLFRTAWHLDAVDHRRRGDGCNPLKFYLIECTRFTRTMTLVKTLAAPRKQWISTFFGRPCSLWLRMRYITLALSGRLYSNAA